MLNNLSASRSIINRVEPEHSELRSVERHECQGLLAYDDLLCQKYFIYVTFILFSTSLFNPDVLISVLIILSLMIFMSFVYASIIFRCRRIFHQLNMDDFTAVHVEVIGRDRRPEHMRELGSVVSLLLDSS